MLDRNLLAALGAEDLETDADSDPIPDKRNTALVIRRGSSGGFLIQWVPPTDLEIHGVVEEEIALSPASVLRMVETHLKAE